MIFFLNVIANDFSKQQAKPENRNADQKFFQYVHDRYPPKIFGLDFMQLKRYSSGPTAIRTSEASL